MFVSKHISLSRVILPNDNRPKVNTKKNKYFKFLSIFWIISGTLCGIHTNFNYMKVKIMTSSQWTSL